MEYEEMKEWLDKLVENERERGKLEFFNSEISTTGAMGTISFMHGIETVADVMGLELHKKALNEDYHHGVAYDFEYGGIRFVQFDDSEVEA